MFSLIITIVAVTLTVSLTAATMYYAGDSTAKGDAATAAASVLTQTEQVGAAIQLREVQTNQALLNSVDQLVADNYLSALPVPADRAYQTGKVPSALDWTVVKPAPVPMVMLQNKIREDVCSLVNEKLHQGAVIKATMDPTRRIQCFGAAEPYTVVINPSANEAVVHESVDHWNATPEVVAKTDPEITPLPEPAAKGGPVVFSGTVTLDPATLPSWKVGDTVSYDFSTLFKTSDTLPPDMSTVVWSSPDTLPKGLTVNPATGALSGKPTEKGTVDYTLKATYKDVTGQQIYKIVVRGLELEAKSVHSAHTHSCAIMLDNTVMCWGDNYFGQLGDGTKISRMYPVKVKNLTDVKQLAIGDGTGGGYFGGHTCALRNNGTVSCWGMSTQSQLGLNSGTHRTEPVTIPSLTNVIDLAAGAGHTCAVIANGRLYCWGNNLNGQLGVGSTTDKYVPTLLSLTSVVSVDAKGYNTCAVLTGGGAACWGANLFGQVGYGYTDHSITTPYTPSGLWTGVKEIHVGFTHTCALMTSGEVFCWGSNGSKSCVGAYTCSFTRAGALGTGDTANSYRPIKVPNLSNIKAIAVGDAFTCSLSTEGVVQCWGGNGNFAVASDGIDKLVPTTVSLNQPATAIIAARNSACAKTIDGVFHCWGNNQYGQFGTGSTGYQKTPTAVLDPSKP